METMFDLDKDFTSHKDEILNLIEETSSKKFELTSGLSFSQMETYKEEHRYYIEKVFGEYKESWGLLNSDISKIPLELNALLIEFKKFYLTRSENKSFTPQEINYIIHKTMIRLNRMLCVVNPEYTTTEFYDKKSEKSYKMIKGYWIDDEGKRVRSLSKNIGNVEASINELIQKLFRSNLKNLTFYEPENPTSDREDLIVFDGKTKWSVETKMLNLDHYIQNFVSLEMWKRYKEKYVLLV